MRAIVEIPTKAILRRFGEYRAEIEHTNGWRLTVARSSDGQARVFNTKEMCDLFRHLDRKYGTEYAINLFLKTSGPEWVPMYKKGAW